MVGLCVRKNVFPHVGEALCHFKETFKSLEEENKAFRTNIKHNKIGCTDIGLEIYKHTMNKVIKELAEETHYLSTQLDAYMIAHMCALHRKTGAALTRNLPIDVGRTKSTSKEDR